jgi:hypothetical protein
MLMMVLQSVKRFFVCREAASFNNAINPACEHVRSLELASTIITV